MATKRLFTDFDGPIMDVSERYFKVYQDCLERTRLPQQRITLLTKAQFWQMKRSQIPETEIAKESGLIEKGQAQAFAELRREIIHTAPYFPFDRLIENAIAALELAQNAGIELCVITMRRQRELEPVLQSHQLSRFFPLDRRFCLQNEYHKTGDTLDKPLLMGKAIATLPYGEKQWIVGDTEADILAGKRFRIQTIGILSGIRDEHQLSLQNPDRILPDLQTAIKFIVNS
jgi:phosphoglycolate phosphatase-like HAD superfamily hydrolase